MQLGTLNLCLGLKNKKDLVKNILISNNLDVLSMQEIEIEHDFDCELLRIPGYVLETEVNTNKKRVGCYVKSNIKYVRRFDLEKANCLMIILDIDSSIGYVKRIINIYRSFNPANMTAKELFVAQLYCIKNAFDQGTFLMGDLNLDYNKKFDVNYEREGLFSLFEEKLGDMNLVQLVNFNTWSRMCGTQLRSSLLDHIYTYLR